MSKKISAQRSEVIEKFINIDSWIDAIISQNYFKKMSLPFLFEFLYDVNCTFALKRSVLEKIVPNFSKMEELRRLNKIRNFFAHCNKEFFEGSTPPKPEERGRIPNPENTMEDLDFNKLHDEFMSKEKAVVEELVKKFESLGGKFLKGLPGQTSLNTGYPIRKTG